MKCLIFIFFSWWQGKKIAVCCKVIQDPPPKKTTTRTKCIDIRFIECSCQCTSQKQVKQSHSLNKIMTNKCLPAAAARSSYCLRVWTLCHDFKIQGVIINFWVGFFFPKAIAQQAFITLRQTSILVWIQPIKQGHYMETNKQLTSADYKLANQWQKLNNLLFCHISCYP